MEISKVFNLHCIQSHTVYGHFSVLHWLFYIVWLLTFFYTRLPHFTEIEYFNHKPSIDSIHVIEPLQHS